MNTSTRATKIGGVNIKIGIIVFSQTGNTLSVAERLQKKIAAAGHEATLERLQVVGEPRPGAPDITFTNLPDLAPYEALVFASPVQAFTVAQGMKNYFAQVSALAGKKAALLVTQQFPRPWLGGNRAIRWLRKACANRNAAVLESAVINWSNKLREQQITDAVERLSGCFA